MHEQTNMFLLCIIPWNLISMAPDRVDIEEVAVSEQVSK